MHYLLTGDSSLEQPCRVPPPLGNAVLGGTPMPIDGTYGPIRYLKPAEVRAVAEALRQIPVEEFGHCFDAVAIKAPDIYAHKQPGGWDEEERELLLELYPRFVAFFDRVANAGNVLLLSID